MSLFNTHSPHNAPFVMTIFGVTGDLTRRKLVPALFDLYREGFLPDQFIILGYARRDWDKVELIRQVGQFIDDSEQAGEFLKHFEYQRGDFGVPGDYKKLHQRLDELNDQLGQCGHRLLYLATPADSYHQIVAGIGTSDLHLPCDPEGWTRLVVEKPFGHDLASAQRLDQELAKWFQEDQIYRIDHYLAKETVQNIITFRFANSIFEALWDGAHISRIEIVVAEEQEVGTRGAFYDKTGALRDVIQNHCLQLLALTTMEQPTSATAEDFRNARAKALGQLKLTNADELNTKLVLGQYSGYREVDQVEPKSNTETFALLEVGLESDRWRNVPVYLATGKALGVSKATIAVYFKDTEGPLFGSTKHSKNHNNIIFHLQPEPGIALTLLAKKPGYGHEVEPVDMHFSYHENFSEQGTDAYARLLVDAINGDQTLFTRSDEVEAEWRFIDTVTQAMEQLRLKPETYKPGTNGPGDAIRRLWSL